MRRIAGVAGRRLAVVPFTLLGLVTLTFVIMRVLPQDQAALRLGSGATPEAVAQLHHELGLDRPILSQYVDYLGKALHGDLGTSYRTSDSVTHDLIQRFPATLELIGYSLFLALAIALPAAVFLALRPQSRLNRIARLYGLVAGGLPDFWISLLLIYFLYFRLHIAPAPLGRLPIETLPPERITGLLTVDSVISGHPGTALAALKQLALPVFALAFVSGGAFFKMFLASMRETVSSPYVSHARALGVPSRLLLWPIVRAAFPSTLTLVSVQATFLLGGAVLVESLFAWDGLGRYAVDAITGADFAAVQGFVLIAGAFTVVVYLVSDVLHAALDPRIELR
jgi:ABC-type dipeptide/oligopeptide/nickel transport system permease component